MNFSISFDLSD